MENPTVVSPFVACWFCGRAEPGNSSRLRSSCPLCSQCMLLHDVNGPTDQLVWHFIIHAQLNQLNVLFSPDEG